MVTWSGFGIVVVRWVGWSGWSGWSNWFWVLFWLWWSKNTDTHADVVIAFKVGHIVDEHVLSEERLAQEPGMTSINWRLSDVEIAVAHRASNISTISPKQVIVQGEFEGGLSVKHLDCNVWLHFNIGSIVTSGIHVAKSILAINLNLVFLIVVDLVQFG